MASLCLTQDTACLGLVHGDDPERCYGEGGGRGVHKKTKIIAFGPITSWQIDGETMETVTDFILGGCKW